jgi:hypothetical protein
VHVVRKDQIVVDMDQLVNFDQPVNFDRQRQPVNFAQHAVQLRMAEALVTQDQNLLLWT